MTHWQASRLTYGHDFTVGKSKLTFTSADIEIKFGGPATGIVSTIDMTKNEARELITALQNILTELETPETQPTNEQA